MTDLPKVMRAWQTVGDSGLRLAELPVPRPAADEVLVRVEACGVCRTDLHVVHGDLAPHRTPVVPGHEIVGIVEATGAASEGWSVGDRVGVPWLRRTCGACRWCRSGAENLCELSTYTGWDADGGYAEYAVAPARFVYRIPDGLDPVQAAPLLCAGIIGYRALERAQLPPGGRLGLYGFGASAHLTLQLALAQGAEVHVVSRDSRARALAMDLGAASAGSAGDEIPPLDSAIVFAPAGEVVLQALDAVDADGTVAVAGIYVSDIPPLDYQRHLFREKSLTSVTSNTRTDGTRFLRLARRLGVRATVTSYPWAQAPRALADLAADAVHGAAVLHIDHDSHEGRPPVPAARRTVSAGTLRGDSRTRPANDSDG